MSSDNPDNPAATAPPSTARVDSGGWPSTPSKLRYAQNRASAASGELKRNRRRLKQAAAETAAAPPRQPLHWRVVFTGLLLFCLFLTYFNLSSHHLPQGAGPDFVHNDDISNFIYENNRLAVLPDDESSLRFTHYGGTRALRPPLSFMTSAMVAKLFNPKDTKELRKAFRKGSALLMSVTVLLGFVALWIYFNSIPIALAGALLMGLMPQFSFIASYNNDDASAILSGTLMLLAMIGVFKRGVNFKTLCLLGLAAGVTIISKQSGWIMFPSVVAFLLLFVLRHLSKAILPAIVALAITLCVGGWWIVFNISHYGLDDPLAQKITKTTAAKHTRFAEDRVLGYRAQGVGFSQLVFENHDAFMTKTLRSTVGNLDWLRLPVGPNHYRFYLLLFCIGIAAWLTRLLALVLPGAAVAPRPLLFESILVSALVVQFLAYVWINVNNDIQTQGKYLLPVLMAAIVLSLSGVAHLARLLAKLFNSVGFDRIELSRQSLVTATMVLVSVVAATMHYDSLKSYVLPYYRPAFYSEKLEKVDVGPFAFIDLNAIESSDRHQIDQISVNPAGAMQFTATGADPWFVMPAKHCAGARDNSLVRVTIESSINSTLTVYWDDGGGFNERNKSQHRYRPGIVELHVWIGPRACRQLRVDPATHPGTFTIHNLSVATLNVSKYRRD